MVSTPAILTLLGALTAMTIPTVHGGSSSIRRNLAISGRITALQLYNADNDAKVVDLVNGTVVNITSLGLSSPSFNINAAVNSTTTRSIAFGFDNAPYRVENLAPFAFCSNNRNDFFKGALLSSCGTYTVSAKPWSNEGAQGDSGPTVAVTFSIVGCPPPPPSIKITGLSLIDSNKDTKVVDLTVNNTVIPLPSGMSTPAFNINKSFAGNVESVVYLYNGARIRSDDVPPFSFCVNEGNDFRSCGRLTCDTHTITAIPYPIDGGNGAAGLPYTVTFTISCVSVSAPNPAPKASAPVDTPKSPIAAPLDTPKAPVIAPTSPITAPKAPAIAPPAPVVAPKSPVAAPIVAPIDTPKAPVLAPTSPITAPKAPAIAPSAPVVAPKSPVAAPVVAPVDTPKAPVLAPTSPIAAPKAPAIAPSAPVDAPKSPVAAPKAPVALPSAPVEAPKSSIAAPIVAPVDAPKAPVLAPTSPIAAPKAPVAVPSAPFVSPKAPATAPVGLAPTTGSAKIVADDFGEWIEINNAGSVPVNLQGWKFSDLTFANTHTIGAFSIPPGSYVIMGRNGNAAINGNVTVAYVYGTGTFPSLNNGGDTITLTDASGSIQDQVNYAQAGFPSTNSAGFSMQ